MQILYITSAAESKTFINMQLLLLTYNIVFKLEFLTRLKLFEKILKILIVFMLFCVFITEMRGRYLLVKVNEIKVRGMYIHISLTS